MKKGRRNGPFVISRTFFFSPKIIAARRIRKVTFDKSLFNVTHCKKKRAFFKAQPMDLGPKRLRRCMAPQSKRLRISFTEAARKPDATIGCISSRKRSGEE